MVFTKFQLDHPYCQTEISEYYLQTFQQIPFVTLPETKSDCNVIFRLMLCFSKSLNLYLYSSTNKSKTEIPSFTPITFLNWKKCSFKSFYLAKRDLKNKIFYKFLNFLLRIINKNRFISVL